MEKKSTRGTTSQKAAPKKPAQRKAPVKKPIENLEKAPQVAKKIKEIPVMGDPVQSDAPENVSPRPLKTRGQSFDVIINGKPRNVSRLTYEALMRDQYRYKIELPEGSPLKAIDIDPKPCKDC